MDQFVTPAKEGELTRKKSRSPKHWKRAKAKTLRYTPKTLPKFPTCNHKKGAFLCQTLPPQDIRRFHERFYSVKDKIYQDNYILKFTMSVPTKRKRPNNGRFQSKPASTKYFINSQNKEMVPVCLNTFLGVLNVSRFRITNIMKRFRKTDKLCEENRGGDRTSGRNRLKKESVMQFLNSLKCSEPHYCANTTGRRYLPSELNIHKLWIMFNRLPEENLKVKEGYFREIFNRNYNLGFGTPRVDVCSTCLQLDERLKHSKCAEEKQGLITDKRVHKLRSKAFYDLLRECNPRILIVSYDCQKNLPLPKIPDQATYYSRQIYLHNFSIVQGNSKSKLNPDNVTSYVWTENEYRNGSNEISSCLFNYLKNTEMPEPYDTLRLVCDGCGGQNKNAILLSMVCCWFVNFAPKNIKTVELNYPITGHSYLPADRVFGLIEKEIRKMEVIYDPQQYINVIKNHATVKKLGEDGCDDFDWKNEKDTYVKPPSKWHFRLQPIKRIFIQKTRMSVKVKGEPYYKSMMGCYRSITKPSTVMANMNPEIIPKTNITKRQKKEDVDSLLKKHYGQSWRENESLFFYKNIIDTIEETNANEDLDGEDLFCELPEEMSTFNV